MTSSQTRYEDEYVKNMERMVSYARNYVGDDAEDVAHDAFLEVMALPELPGDIGGLLMQRLKWRIMDNTRRRDAILEADLGDTDDDDELRPMRLDDLESLQVQHGSTPPWPSAVDHDTPEGVVSADQLRNHIRNIAIEQCGDGAWAMFCAVMMDGTDQGRVAREFKVDQTTVSRTVARVRDVVAAQLTSEGFDVNG